MTHSLRSQTSRPGPAGPLSMNAAHRLTRLLLLAVAWLALPLAAQDVAPDAPPAAATPAAPTEAPVSAPTAAEATGPAGNPAPADAAPVEPGPASADAGRNIRFQFDGIPYADVIERFAQMTGRPLVGDANLPGTLTFNDPNPYNYREALDTLNLMLSMKGRMLVEEGNYLRLVPFTELPSMPLPIYRGTDTGGEVRPGEVVTVVLDLKNLDAGEISGAVTNLLSTAGSIAPLSRGSGLIVTDRLANIQRIQSLIAAVDNEAVAERQMRTYTLLHSSGAVVADLLNRTFGISSAPKRTQFNPQTKQLDVLPPNPNDYVTAVYDDASRTLVLFGPRERLALSDELVKRFEDGGGGAGDVRIYTPELVPAEELATMIRQAIPGVASPGETGSAAATKARVIAEKAGNRLIVATPLAGQADQIEALINRLDKPVHGTGGSGAGGGTRGEVVQLTRVFRTRTADAPAVAKILTEALSRRLPSGTTVARASVSVEAGSQSIVVTGSPGDVQTATDIIAQLETGSTHPQAQETRMLDFASAAEARRLQPLIEQIYRSQVVDGLGGSSAHAKILVEPDSSRLIVTATPEHLARIEQIAADLREGTPRNPERALHLVTLRNTRVDEIIGSLNSLVAERMAGPRFAELPKPSVVADPANNRLLVTATDEQRREIDQIVSVLDITPEAGRREMAVIPVAGKSPTELIALVSQLISQMDGRTADPQMAPRLIPDASGRQVIVMATAADIQRVRSLVQQLDTASASASARQFKGVDLHRRQAADFAPLVEQLYREQLKGLAEPAGGAATILPDRENNRLMVSGTEAEIARVEAIVRQIDPAGDTSAPDETRVIRLRMAVASEIAGLVEKSLGAQAAGVRVLVDARSNSLVLTGPPAAVETAAAIIRQLDTASDAAPREMRVIDLKQGEASAVSALATSLATDILRSQRGPEYTPQTRILPDPAGNRLVVSGPRGELETVARVVEQLDREPEAAGGARVFRLENADASLIVGVVSNAMLKFDARNQPIRRVSVSLERESNSIVVSGSRTDLKDAEAIIQRLDGGDDTLGTRPGRNRELKLVSVNGDPDTLAALALRVFATQNAGRPVTNLVSITPAPNGRRLILLAPDTLLPQVEQVVAALDGGAEDGARELHAIELPGGRASEVLPAVNRIYAEQNAGRTGRPATLYPDASGGRLMVYGTREQADAIRQIASTVSGDAPVDRDTRVLDAGRLAEAQRLLPLLQQLYRDRLAGMPGSGAADAQIVSDGRTGRLVASGRTAHLDLIGELFEQLRPGEAATARRVTRTVDIGSPADVQRLLPLVQQLYTDQARTRGEEEPADAQILPDPTGGRLVVTGREADVEQIEALVRQLGAGTTAAGKGTRETRVIDLSTASAVELAGTVRTLYDEQARGRFGNIRPDTLITPDAGGNRLIVVGETNELAVVESLVAQLDRVSAQSASTRVFRIKSAEPSKVAEILTSALTRFDAYGRAQKRASVSVDANSRTLIVTGDPKELQGVSLIIEQLDTSLGARPERRMKVLALRQGRVAEMTGKVRQLYNDQVRNQPDLALSEILLLEDVPGNQLIAAGSDEQLTLVEGILRQLEESTTAREERVTRSFELGRPEEVARVQPLVQQLYAERWKGRDAADPADAQFVADAPNGRLIATGRPAHLEEIARLVDLVRPDPVAAEGRDLRVYDLLSARAGELAGTVRSLYERQARSRSVAAADQAVVFPDIAANRLVVSGSSNEVAALDPLIRQLDQPSDRTARTRVFALTNALPQQVAGALSETLVNLTPWGRSTPRVTVGTDDASRSVIVSGDPADLEDAARIVRLLDAAPNRGPRSLKVFPVATGTASDLSGRLQRVVVDQLQSRGLAADAVIVPDDAGGRVLVTASAEQLEVVEGIFREMELVGGGGREAEVIPLTHVTAEALLPILNQLFSRDVMGRQPGGRLVVTATPDDQSLLVDGPAPVVARVRRVLTALDVAETGGRSVIQTVQLRKAQAQELAESVTESLRARGTEGGLQRVSITPVEGANSLLLNGPGEAVEEVVKLVRELDSESTAGEIEVRVYPLKSADARQTAPVLTQLLAATEVRSGRRGSGRGRGAGSTVTIDARSNSLLVSGSEVHFKLVEQLLPTLDRAPERADRDVQFVWLKNARAFDVQDRIEAVYSDRPRAERPVVEADSAANSLTLIARPADMTQIQDLIRQLDQISPESSLQVRLLTVDIVPVDQIVTLLTNIYPQVHGSPVRIVDRIPDRPVPAPGTNDVAEMPPEVLIAIDRGANAVLVSGSTTDIDQIDRMIFDLSWNKLTTDTELKVIPLQDADPVVVARILNDLFRPEPGQPQPQQGGDRNRPAAPARPPRLTAVAETRTRSVVIRARPEDYPIVESIIRQMDAAGGTSLEYRLVDLKHTPATKLAPLVQQVVQQVSAQRPGDPLTVIPYERTRSLLLVARGGAAEEVEKLIRSLDIPAADTELEVRVFDLRNSPAAQLAGVLQNLVRPGGPGELTPEARELQEQIRRLRVRGTNGVDTALDISRPLKITADPARGNRLLVSSTPENLTAVAAIVDLLDRGPVAPGLDVRFVHLNHADAATVAQSLNTIFAQALRLASGPTGPGEPEGEPGRALVGPLNVTADPRLNGLLLAGRPESLDLAGRILEDLDQEWEGFYTEVRLIRVKFATASRLLPLLQSVFAEGPPVPGSEGVATYVTRLRALRENGRPVTTDQPKVRAALTLQADDAANVIVVAARNDALPLIEEVVAQLDVPDAGGVATVRIYPLENADAASVRRVLTELYSGPRAATLRPEERPTLSLDDRSNALIVSGNEKAFGVVEGLIAQIDKPLPLELRDIRILPLENADAAELAGTLQRLMDQRVTRQAALGRGQADSLRVLIVPENRSNSLLIGGGQDAYDLVASLAAELDKSAPELKGAVRLVTLEHADARVVASSLAQFFTQRYQAAATPDVQRRRPVILPDARINGLLVSAGRDDNALLDDLLTKLDRKLDNPALVVEVLALRNNDAAVLATTLEGVFTARLQARTVPGQPQSPTDRVSIETDSLNNALIVSASRENLEVLRELLAKLDAEPVVPGGVLETFVLKHADAQRVATLLRSLVQQGLYRPGRSGGGGRGGGQGGRDALAVAVDPRSNSLIVSASPENLALVRGVLEKVDTTDFTGATELKLYLLEHARAANLAGVLSQFFQAKRTGDAAVLNSPERSVPVAVIPDTRLNALLVTGTKESFDILDRIIPELDGEDRLDQLNFRVFPLRQATALKLQGTLRQLFANRPARTRGEPADPITVVADQWVNAVIVGAVVEDMGMVESLITRLDTQQAELGLNFEVVPLQKADARRVAETLQGLFRDGTQSGPVPIVVNADERVNALVVSAGEADLKRIREVAAKLDTDQVARVSEIRVIPLKHARADAMTQVLTAALNSRPPQVNNLSPNAQSVLQFVTRTEDGRQLVTAALKESIVITPDLRMNALIVSGPVDYMGLLEQIVGRLDNSSPRQAEIKVFTLRNADAQQTGQLLLNMFRMQPVPGAVAGGQRTIQYTLMRPNALGFDEPTASVVLGSEEESALTVSVDARTNTLLVGGTEHYVALVAQIIETLDSSEALERRTQVYRLRNAQAVDVGTAIRNFLDQERQRVTQVLGADAVGTAQRMLEREVAIVPETVSNTLLLSASPRYFEQVYKIIEELDLPQPQVLIQVMLAEVTLDSVRDLGVEWSYTKNVGSGFNLGTGTDFGVAPALRNFGGYSALVTGNDFNFVLRALENDGRLEVLSRPQILTADNRPASINIGQRVPIITSSVLTPQGGTQNQFDYRDVGVNLTVTPRITGDGFVRIEVGATNSSISSSTVQINADATVPIINERRASTMVTVQSGQTVVIGGLIGTTDDIRKKKMPVLGDIPVLGVLFRSSTRTSERRELLIMLTPQILTASNELSRTNDVRSFTREQLDQSTIRDGIQRDRLQRQVLDPLYPADPPAPRGEVAPGRKQPSGL